MENKNQQITFPLDPISTQIIQKDLLVYQSKTAGSIVVKINGINYTLSSASAGLSVTITTAKLTSGGTNGSMTFTNGLLTASTPAT